MNHISAIIVHYNTPSETKACLQSLSEIKKTGFRLNTIVLDNGSKELFKLPQKFSLKEFEVIRSEANLGFSGGNNLAIEYALKTYNSEYVLLLNSDATVDTTALTKLHKAAQSNPKWGMISPLVYFAPGFEYHKESYSRSQRGKIIWYAGGSIDWPNLTAFHRGVDELDRGQFDFQKESDFATGCCVLVKRELLERVGHFDDRFFLYFEDLDLSLRARKAGFVLGFEPKAKVWHANASSGGGSGSYLQQYYQTRNRLLFVRKHATWRTKLTAFRFALRLFRKGSSVERKAVLDFMLGKLGKQPVA